MRAVLIGLAVLVFAVVLNFLNWLMDKVRADRLAHLWNERERWRVPDARPRRSGRHRARRPG
jgi:hypothetical protein